MTKRLRLDSLSYSMDRLSYRLVSYEAC